MYPANFRYHRAGSLAEAARMLIELGPDAKPMAGGQTLIPLLKLRLLKPTDVVDLGRITDAHEIVATERAIRIGALATHGAIGTSSVAAQFPILRDCALGIADAQVRSMGTIGGSLAEADPCSCWPALLTALGASVETIGPNGARTLTVAELLRDAFTLALEPGELIAAIVVDRAALDGVGTFVAFKRSAPSYPTASCALQIAFAGEEVASLRLGLGCVALTPKALPQADALVRGRAIGAQEIEAIAQLAAAAAEPIADNKGSEAYKRSLVQGLVRKAFAIVAARRAGATGETTHFYYG